MISVCGLFFRSCVRVHVGGLVCVTTIGCRAVDLGMKSRCSPAGVRRTVPDPFNVDGKQWGEVGIG